MAAAQAHRPELLENPRLRQAYELQRYPYASFLDERHFGRHQVSALAVLCGPRATQATDWRQCSGDDDLVERLRNRVVVVGDNMPDQDQHPSVIGPRPGVFLHANYIEALLDERVFDAVPNWLDIAIGLIMAIALDYAILVSFGPIQLLGRVLILIVAAFSLSYFAVVVTGRYINPLPVGMLALVLRVISRPQEWVWRR